MGNFHCPVCGLDFESEIVLGEYDVTCPNGHVLSYVTNIGEDRSQCTCPICSKVFDVDLIPEFPGLVDVDDVPESMWSEYYDESLDGDFTGFLNRLPARRSGSP